MTRLGLLLSLNNLLNVDNELFMTTTSTYMDRMYIMEIIKVLNLPCNILHGKT